LVVTLIRWPGALLRLPTTALTALDAINDMAERLEPAPYRHHPSGQGPAGLTASISEERVPYGTASRSRT
jgi:hypothetical protein